MACHPILLIEDEPDLRETLKELLELEGYSVSTAENGREGLQKIEEIGKPCVVFLDLMMPVMSGWEVLENLKTESQPARQSFPVVVVSAAADVTDINSKYGCRVMKKPVDFNDFMTVAKQHCVAQ